jgi:hypothetical protein
MYLTLKHINPPRLSHSITKIKLGTFHHGGHMKGRSSTSVVARGASEWMAMPRRWAWQALPMGSMMVFFVFNIFSETDT